MKLIKWLVANQKQVASGAALFLLVICYMQQKQMTKLRQEVSINTKSIQTIDSLQHLADSLYDENFPCQIELGRYQVAYQIFLERDPQGAKIYGDIISDETE